uniref:DUF7847 domain-containing protein n=2 Tax=Candidatus Bipolaricaulota TaxID=67810 RepID=H5SV35_ACEAU|nr:hypothetical conserved protein [uncultured Acetothermia bacterium]BAL59464.1 hypothetical protein HGMM_OP4C100 [Candidatus Acetothermum autotrophicum]
MRIVRSQVSFGEALTLGSTMLAAPLLWAMLGGLLVWNLFAYFSGLSWLILAPSSRLPKSFIEIIVDFLLFPALNAIVIRFVYTVVTKSQMLSLTETIFSALGRFPTLVGLHAIFVIAGYIFTITPDIPKLLVAIPAIYVWTKLIFAYQEIVAREADVWEALSTSWKLTEGNWWRMFFLALIPGLIMIPFTVEGSSQIVEGTIGWISSFWLWCIVTYAYAQLTARQ